MAHILVCVIALATGKGNSIVITAIFTALWLLSAWCSTARRERGHRRPPAPRVISSTSPESRPLAAEPARHAPRATRITTTDRCTHGRSFLSDEMAIRQDASQPPSCRSCGARSALYAERLRDEVLSEAVARFAFGRIAIQRRA